MFDNNRSTTSESRVFSNDKGYFFRVSDDKVKGPFLTRSEAMARLKSSVRSLVPDSNHFSWSDLRVIKTDIDHFY